LASGGDDKTVFIWNLEDYSKIKEIKSTSNNKVAFSENGLFLAVADKQGKIKLFDT
jgi:WD40 repeat protein